MNKRNGNKGITLIALVITIIVLLILAGVSIGMLIGNNSILKNATQARKNSAISSVREQVLMAVNTAYTDYQAKLVTHTLNEGETLYSDTNAALGEITSNNSEVEYNYSSNKVTIKYTKDSTEIKGTLDSTTGAFSWD